MDINKKNQKNHGIALLRVLLSFMVVLDHSYNRKKKKEILHILYYHIPTFLLLSFYFTYNTFSQHNLSKIKLRFERLLIPYFCWSFFNWIIINIYYYRFKRKGPHKLHELFEGLLNGHSLNITLWFQVNLILTSLVIAIIVFLFKKRYLLIFKVLFILSYILQYSGLNYYFFFTHYNDHYLTTYSRFLNTLPESITGFLISAYNISYFLKPYKYQILILCLIFLLIVSKYKFDNSLILIRYGGIRLNIASICLFFIFFYLPCDKIKNKKIINFINIITDYTAGIYFVHYMIKTGYIIHYVLDIFNSSIHILFKW